MFNLRKFNDRETADHEHKSRHNWGMNIKNIFAPCDWLIFWFFIHFKCFF